MDVVASRQEGRQRGGMILAWALPLMPMSGRGWDCT